MLQDTWSFYWYRHVARKSHDSYNCQLREHYWKSNMIDAVVFQVLGRKFIFTRGLFKEPSKIGLVYGLLCVGEGGFMFLKKGFSCYCSSWCDRWCFLFHTASPTTVSSYCKIVVYSEVGVGVWMFTYVWPTKYTSHMTKHAKIRNTQPFKRQLASGDPLHQL